MEIIGARHITTEQYQLLEKENIELRKENAELKLRITYLEQELANLKRMIFGSKSERHISENHQQTTLDLGVEPIEPEPVVKTQEITITRKEPQKAKQIPVRDTIPSHLPRIKTVIIPEVLPAGAKKIGEVVTEILEYQAGRIVVKCYIRNKYVLPEEEKIIIADLPTLPLPKANAGAGLLSHLIVSKYVDHLPIYRINQIFKRTQNLSLPESTVSGWLNQSANLLEPLYEKLKKSVLESSYIQADETTIPVQTSEKKGATHTGYLWVYHSPPDKAVFFDYNKSRSTDAPTEILKNFSGSLQTDGYAAYNSFDNKPDVTLLACMAHARRKFEQSLSNDKSLAEYALAQFQALYNIERIAREQNMDYQQIKDLRQERAVPVINNFETWLNEQSKKVLPQSAIGKAINYTINLWSRLTKYTGDGKYQIDNNLIENTIRPVALGRKNYLFAGSHQAAQRAAMFYSFFATCKINQINPYEWLNHILSVILNWKANQLDQLLPQNFKQLIKEPSTC
jgi:transposase